MPNLNTELLLQSRIPRRYWELGKKDFFGDTDTLEAVRHYLRTFVKKPNTPVGLRLTGPPHSGKTYYATFALKILLARGYTVSYYTLDDLCSLQFNELDEEETTFRNRILAPQMICFDDINGPPGNGHKLGLLRAIRLRSNESLPYIVCTRFGDDDLLNYYGIISENTNLPAEGDLLRFFQRDLVSIELPDMSFNVAAADKKIRQPFVHVTRG